MMEISTKNSATADVHPHDGLLCDDSLDVVTSLYLRYIGEHLDKEDLWRGLPYGHRSSMSYALLERALKRNGFAVRATSSKHIQEVHFPCVLVLQNGRFAFATGLSGDSVCLVDGRAGNIVRMLPLKSISLYYSGKFLNFFPTMGELERRHSVVEKPKHWFWGRLFRPRSRVIDVVLASIVANLIAVTVSLFAMQVYDRVIPNQNQATLWALALGASIAILFEFFLRSARSKLIDETGKAAEIEMNRELFQRVLGMRLDRLPAGPGSVAYMVREFQGIREFFNTATVGVLADLPFVFIFFLVIYFIAGPVVWIVVTGSVAIILPSLLYQGRMARLSKETQGGLSSASRLLTEAAYGLENAKSARAESWLLKSWEEITHLNAIKSSEQRNLTSKLTFWAGSVQQWSYISAIVGGTYLLFSGEFTIGSIIAISILSGRTLSPISQLSGVLTRWQNMRIALKAMDKIIDAEQERQPGRSYIRRSRFNGQLSMSGVEAIYAPQTPPVIQIERLALKTGDRLAVLGANGSGKSTLLRVLSGFQRPSDGDYLIDNLDVRQLDPDDLRRNIGYLPQETKLFRGTLRQNLQIPQKKFLDNEIFEALKFGGLFEMVKVHPKGMDLPILDGGGGLSTGQKTSVGLARLYLSDPSIVVLDEPTAALDQDGEACFVRNFDNWLGQRTCVIATHRTAIIQAMTKVAIMQNGRLVVFGPKDAVLAELGKQGAIR